MEAADDGTVSLKLQEMGLLLSGSAPPRPQTLLKREFEWPWRKEQSPAQGPPRLHPGVAHARACRIPAGPYPHGSRPPRRESAMAEVVQDVLKE